MMWDFIHLFLSLCMIGLVVLLMMRIHRLQDTRTKQTADLERMEKSLRQDLQLQRQEHTVAAREARTEMQNILQNQAQTNLQTLAHISEQQQLVLRNLVNQLEQIRVSVEQKLTVLQEDNNKKLEQMRATVEEKLQSTLEQRLGESFKLVSDRLEQVHKGLGEMQTLASGVGDLKKVLGNIKNRGTLGEIQLSNLLEQMFAPEQYEKEVSVRPGSQEKVEYAIKLPAKEEARGYIHLPVDSKFPLEDYQRLLQAQEDGDREREQQAMKGLISAIKTQAKKIRDKYIHPPYTTDFAVMFLPFEGLYAEVLRQPGLWDLLQRECRVVITGPTTLSALLNSLQMGFRTLAIQKRSSEVWQLLGAVKTKFSAFGVLLEKAQKKIEEAGRTIESATSSTRKIEKKLAKVEQLDLTEAGRLLELDADFAEQAASDDDADGNEDGDGDSNPER